MNTKQLTIPHGARLLVLALAIAVSFGVALLAAPGADASGTRHYMSGTSGSWPAVQGLGYDLMDVNPSVSTVNSLPAGLQALVWIGSGQKCPQPRNSTFDSQIDSLAGNPKVFGYYLSDEPETASCSSGPANLKARADYVKAKHPGAKTFIVIDNQSAFSPYRPSVTGVDLVGLDPYGCNVNNADTGCDLTKIGERVNWALSGGWSQASLVPTFQTFGQTCTAGGDHYYRFPTDSELRAMLAEWDRLVPNPVMDYSYTWKNQVDTSCPTLVDKPSAQQIMKEHNTGGAPATTTTTTTTSSSTTPTPTTSTVTETVTQTVTSTPPVRVSELACSIGTVAPTPGDVVTCAYR